MTDRRPATASGPAASSTVVCSILEPDADRMRRSLARAPSGAGLVELRADRLRSHEVADLVGPSGRALIVTVRRRDCGGGFDGSEDERRAVLLAALDAGAALIDVEWGTPLQDLAQGDRSDRVILSHHGVRSTPGELEPLYRSLAASRAARLKIVPTAERPADCAAVRALLQTARRDRRPLACFAMGRAGVVSRVMAPAWGSWATFGALEAGKETAPGQLGAGELLELYDVLGIGPETRIFGLIGQAVFGSPSPAMHHAAYRAAGLDARYVPIEIDEMEDCLPLVGPQGLLRLEGLAVTIPFKDAAAPRCRLADEIARSASTVNTIRIEKGDWTGFNTDGPAVVELASRRLKLSASRVAVVGAGGTARAAAAALLARGSRVTLFNRSPERARIAATSLGVDHESLERLDEASWDLLVQATPLGRRGERVLAAGSLNGSMVLDAVYGVETPLILDARRRGLAVADGFDLLVAQAVLQHARLTGLKVPSELMREAGRHWLDGRTANAPGD